MSWLSQLSVVAALTLDVAVFDWHVVRRRQSSYVSSRDGQRRDLVTFK